MTVSIAGLIYSISIVSISIAILLIFLI
jgi:hypothetical protein